MTEQTRPAANAGAVTPSDSTLLSGVRSLYVGTSGDVAVKFPGNATAVVFSNVPDGAVLPVQVVQVMSTSTTASNIVALY